MNRIIACVIVIFALLGSALYCHCHQGLNTDSPGTRAAIGGLIVSDNITADTEWNALTYPFIYVAKDIWVAENVTLTIVPGVTVKFELGASLHVKGNITADGSPYQTISFKPFSDTPATMDWEGITLENCTGPCIFDNAAISYSEVGIGCWGSDLTLTNSSIEFTFYYGVRCGMNCSPVVRANYVNFTTWVGIVCDNKSTPVVDGNRILTCYYGIVCYDVAYVVNNKIETCWIGIIGWGNSTIAHNDIYQCRDGIHGFYAAPIIDGNTIRVCGGNGTRFIHSNATIMNNRLVYNHVGMDIDYESRHILANMVNNTVNGIEVTDCFYVGRSDFTIDGLQMDSGWSKGYYGTLTAQGSVTLYDCSNVTMRNSNVSNTMNSVFATNSSFTVYNSEFFNSLKSQIYLDENATGTAFNGSVDPDSVIIGGYNCLFQTFDGMRARVLDYYGDPIAGARVVVRESQLVLHNVTTDQGGSTPVMVVKDGTVSEAGVILSPLNIQVFAEGYNFDPNPLTGIYVSQTKQVTFTDLGDIFPPEIIGLSFEDGDRAFPVDSNITIMFSEPMNHTLTEAAFAISGNATGTFTWDGRNMTFHPDSLDYSKPYTVTVGTGATDLWSNGLAAPYVATFTTASAPGTGRTMIAIVIIIIFAVACIAGWLVMRKMK